MNQNIEELLAKPFPPEDIEWRVSRCGINKNGEAYAWVVPYIDSRAVMERLDQVFGVAGWQDSYQHYEDGFIATLKVKIGDEWIEKSDGAPKTNYEGFKGGISDALKRVAVKFKIGRYLYNLHENYVTIHKKMEFPTDKYIFDDHKKVSGFWSVPLLPQWALPDGYEYTAGYKTDNGKNGNGNGNGDAVDILGISDENDDPGKKLVRKQEQLLARAEKMKDDGYLTHIEYDKTVAAIEKYGNLENKLNEISRRLDKKMLATQLN